MQAFDRRALAIAFKSVINQLVTVRDVHPTRRFRANLDRAALGTNHGDVGIGIQNLER